jgi:hypothetical protein
MLSDVGRCKNYSALRKRNCSPVAIAPRLWKRCLGVHGDRPHTKARLVLGYAATNDMIGGADNLEVAVVEGAP